MCGKAAENQAAIESRKGVSVGDEVKEKRMRMVVYGGDGGACTVLSASDVRGDTCHIDPKRDRLIWWLHSVARTARIRFVLVYSHS